LIHYWLWRIGCLIWQRLPLKVGYACASFVADIVYLAWPRGRACARENMARVLGDGADARTIDRLARQSLRNYCKYLVDFIRFPLLDQQDIEGRVTFNGWRHVDEALEGGKGAIFIGLHMGNWDMAAAAISLRQYPLNAIAESLKPKKLNDIIQGIRNKWGIKVIPMEQATKGIMRALRKNEILALLIDRPQPVSGVKVEFCDGLTQVPAGAATLALRTGARVVPGGVVRLPDNTFLGWVDRYIPFQRTGDLQRDVQALTQQIMDSLEKMVRRYPDQWYMFRPMWECDAEVLGFSNR